MTHDIPQVSGGYDVIYTIVVELIKPLIIKHA